MLCYIPRYIKIHMYLGLFVTIHQETSGYKITIHVSWMRRPSRAGYTQDTFEMQCRYVKDTYPGLVLFALLPKELKAIRLFVTRVGRHVWRTAASVCCAASGVPEGGIRLSGGGMGLKYLRTRFFKSMSCSRCTAAVFALFISLACPCSCFKVGTSARRNACAIHERYMRDTCGIHAGYMYLQG
jgi:hypothetical protein